MSRDVLPAGTNLALYATRSVVAKRLKAVPVEAIARGYLIGSGWKDYQATGALCGIDLPAGSAAGRTAAGADFHAVDESRVGQSRREHRLRRSRRADRRRSGRTGARRDARDLRFAARVRRRRAASSSPTPSSNSAPTKRQAVRHGRNADAGFLALLAGGRIPRRHQPAELRQAVRARLSGNARLEQDSAGAEGAGRRDPPHRREICRGVAQLAGIEID